jgi:flagellar hook-associated protein 3 FlgL
VTVPNSINAATPDCTTDVTEHSFQRIRLGYGNTTDDVKLSIDGKELAQGTDYTVYKSVSDFDPSKLSADDMAYIQETGEFVFGKNVAASIKDNDKKMSVTYVKTGFDSSDLIAITGSSDALDIFF